MALNPCETMPRSNAVANVTEASKCLKCSEEACAEEHVDPAFNLQEVLLFACRKCPPRKVKRWYYCKTCFKRFNYTTLNDVNAHAKKKGHVKLLKATNPTAAVPVPPTAAATEVAPLCTLVSRLPAFNQEDIFVGGNVSEDVSMDVSEPASEPAPAPEEEQEQQPTNQTNQEFPLAYECPNLSMEGNQWLAKAFEDFPRAGTLELELVFSHPSVAKMKHFWGSERFCGTGREGARTGGGLVYITSRCFQQASHDCQLLPKRYATLKESMYQFKRTMQHCASSEKQRRRQAELDAELIAEREELRRECDVLSRMLVDQGGPARKTTLPFLVNTFIPEFKHLPKYYGRNSAKHSCSMINLLPTPEVANIGGVAVVPLRGAIQWALALGIPVDNIVATADGPPRTVPDKVYQIKESRKVVDIINSCQKTVTLCGESTNLNSNPSTTVNNIENGAPGKALVLPITVWEDGFAPSKVKNNRTTVNFRSISLSPPQKKINSCDNTLIVAIGAKSAEGWEEAERLFLQQLNELSKQPVPFYHGHLQKVIPVIIKRVCFLSDKQGRNGLTGTSACTSMIHRCFSVLGVVRTPSCNIDRVASKLAQQSAPKFGWSHDCVNADANGSKLPSCKACRRKVLALLGVPVKVPGSEICKTCCNWDMITDETSICSTGTSMTYPAHKDYPTHIAEGCPVRPPKGRDSFGEDLQMPFIRLTWDVLKNAARFAFYQTCHGAWNKSHAAKYLGDCGLAGSVTEGIIQAAMDCKASGDQDTVSYNDPLHIGDYTFPAAWSTTDIAIRDYVEAIMHELYLGIATSNYDLTMSWMSSIPAASKIAAATFRTTLQRLIKDLRWFQLPWLKAYPLTGTKKGGLGTGSWVAENWAFYVRISPFIYGWCTREKVSAKYGVDDMSRLIQAYHCVVARIMTHCYVSDKCIKETRLYMKEFLSCVRELDVRVNHKKLAKLTKSKGKNSGKIFESAWMKSNYLSLQNICYSMHQLGLPRDTYDGSGRGEKPAQKAKPFLKLGVKGDEENYFVNLLNKLFESDTMTSLEERMSAAFGMMLSAVFDSPDHPNIYSLKEMMDALAIERDLKSPLVSEGGDNESSEELDADAESESSSESESSESESEEEEEDDIFMDCEEEDEFSNSERHGMKKRKVIYVYRSETTLRRAFAAGKPIAGFVKVTDSGFQFKVVYRQTGGFVKQLVNFNDRKGGHRHSLWCAPAALGEVEEQVVTDFSEIQNTARLAAVAIPNSYSIGPGKHDSNKYVVLTNWWKIRESDGTYCLPTLDPTLYGCKRTQRRPGTGVNVVIRNGLQTGAI